VCVCVCVTLRHVCRCQCSLRHCCDVIRRASVANDATGTGFRIRGKHRRHRNVIDSCVPCASVVTFSRVNVCMNDVYVCIVMDTPVCLNRLPDAVRRTEEEDYEKRTVESGLFLEIP